CRQYERWVQASERILGPAGKRRHSSQLAPTESMFWLSARWLPFPVGWSSHLLSSLHTADNVYDELCVECPVVPQPGCYDFRIASGRVGEGSGGPKKSPSNTTSTCRFECKSERSASLFAVDRRSHLTHV